MISIPADDESRIAQARRQASALATPMGFDEVAVGQIGIIVSELTTNTIKFGEAGELLLGTFEDATGSGIEVIAGDRGPKFADVDLVMRDGYSTSGTSGQGLGSVRRLCSAFDVVSWPSIGTGVLARLHLGKGKAASAIPQSGHIVVPLAMETVSVDALCIRFDGESWTVFVADGLGHGPMAAQSADEAVRLFWTVEHDGLADILAAVHKGLRHTREAAIAVCRYMPNEQHVLYQNIGNILLCRQQTRRRSRSF